MRSSPPASMTTRQKVTIGLLIAVVVLVGWQAISLFKNSSGGPAYANKMAANPTPPSFPVPQTVPLPKPPALTPQEADALKLQKQNEERYVAAVNQLQMLKVERDIAETNKAIVAAKLDTATAEKNMVSVLQPSVPTGAYAQGLAGPAPTQSSSAAVTAPPASSSSQVSSSNYVVISVSLLQGRWSAVLGSQGQLYQVYVGDILPADGAKVIEIDRSGVILKYGDQKKKVSLVPII